MKILVIKLSSLGDLFHPLPAVRCLKRGLGAEIHWVVQDEYADIVACFSDVSRIIRFPRRRFAASARRFLLELRRDRYDIVIDFQGLLKSALTACAARAARRIGPSFHREGAGFFYDETAGPRNKRRHAVDENLDVVRRLGLDCGPIEFPMTVPKAGRAEPRPRVAMFVASRWPTKNWPARGFARVAARLAEEAGATVYLAGGPGDTAAAREVEESARPARVVNLAGSLSLAEMAGLLAEVDLVVSNDTGPVHAAAALGKPVLAIFGPTDAARTGPYGPNQRIIASGIDCRPCFSRKCRRGDIACMAGIAPDAVFEAAKEMLAGV